MLVSVLASACLAFLAAESDKTFSISQVTLRLQIGKGATSFGFTFIRPASPKGQSAARMADHEAPCNVQSIRLPPVYGQRCQQ